MKAGDGEARPCCAWICCVSGGKPCAWDESGVRLYYRDSAGWAPLLQPPSQLLFGGIGDNVAELLDLESFEERLGFTLTTSICAASPELQRNLPLENLPPDALPPELVPDPAMRQGLEESIRTGRTAGAVFVAPDAYGGYGLYAAEELAPNSLIGEYVGTLCRGTAATATDPYIMSYPGAAGALYLTAKDAGSVARFINHAPRGSPANNATCWAVLIDGAYHICVMTTRAVRVREEFACTCSASPLSPPC